MDPVFTEILNYQVKKFRNAIMRDYWNYRHEIHAETGFYCLGITTAEYQLQKYFDIRLEDYIRRYLLNGFLGRVLEARGNGIYPPNYRSIIDEHKHYTNKDFEEAVKYEFVADFVQSNNRAGVRYTDCSTESFSIEDDIAEIYVIHWENLGKDKHQDITKLANGKVIKRTCLRLFMEEVGFSLEEYQKYVTILLSIIMEVQEIIGIKSIPALNSAMLFRFRFEVEKEIIGHVNEIKGYLETEKMINELGMKIPDDFIWAYHIIDSQYRNQYPGIEEQTKEVIKESGALKRYFDNKYYLSLIGKSDFAKSFITSEYLFKQYDCSDQFDYTAIVSGYLKCVEQLLYHIVHFVVDKDLQIKSTNKKPNGTELPFRVPFTSENLENGCCDTTMGSLSYLIKDSKNYIITNSQYRKCIFECLQCYTKECRNDSFHKHNITNWSRVEFIKKNTMILIELLLGICRLGNTQEETYEQLGIVQDDRLERFYEWMTSIPSRTFYIQFERDVPKQVEISASSDLPSFSNWGLMTDYIVWLDRVDDNNAVTGMPNKCYLKRDRLPQKMWYIDKTGN